MGDESTLHQADAARTGNRLALAVLGYFVLIVLVITLSPFDFSPARFRISLRVSPRDMLLNIALFLPIGFLLRSLDADRRRRGWRAALVAASLSLLIELCQLFLRSRYVSPVDVLTNSCGACLGIALRNQIERSAVWRPGVVDHVGLNIPLVGLLYLLVPQLWLSSVGLVEDAWRSITTLLLGCAGSIVLVSLHRHQWQGGVRLAANVVPPLALLWFVVGALPALTGSVRVFGTISLALVIVTYLLVRNGAQPGERRFEAETLQRFAPVFVLYLVTAALWSPFRPIVPWHGALGFLDRLDRASIVKILLLLEQVGGFTLLGYAMAEWRGRRELALAPDLLRAAGTAVVFAILLELAQGVLTGPGASLLRALLSTSGAVYGAAVYHLARAHVRALRRERDVPESPAERAAA